MRKVLLCLAALFLLLPFQAFAEEAFAQGQADELRQKLNTLEEQMKALQKQIEALEKEKAVAAPEAAAVEEPPAEPTGAVAPWLELGGDFRSRLDYLKGDVPDYFQFGVDPATGGFLPTPVSGHDVKNETLLTNRLGLNVKARATEDVQVKARLLMYKIWGHETADPLMNSGESPFFADRVNPFDGSVTHVPQDANLRVDYAYATWSNVFGQPAWFSVGRRPSTGGAPSNIRQNKEKLGTAGIPNILVDYAFDGLSIGYAPYIEALPGAYAKFCYGRGFDAGWESDSVPDLDDVDFVGLNIVPYDTENLHIELQYNAGFNIFDTMSDGFTMHVNPATGLPAAPGEPFIEVTLPVSANLGNIHWLGGVVMGKVKENLNLFVSSAVSRTDPTSTSTFAFADFTGDGIPDPVAGLLNDCDPTTGICPTDEHTGYAIYVGGRYDIPATGTKIGAEFNYGSKNWISVIPAADDLWTSKLGTRGKVYELYVIQELKKKPISKLGKAFFRLGYQYYDFDYTGSNNWVGAPKKIDDLDNPMNAQFFTPIEKAQDVYLTFDVQF